MTVTGEPVDSPTRTSYENVLLPFLSQPSIKDSELEKHYPSIDVFNTCLDMCEFRILTSDIKGRDTLFTLEPFTTVFIRVLKEPTRFFIEKNIAKNRKERKSLSFLVERGFVLRGRFRGHDVLYLNSLYFLEVDPFFDIISKTLSLMSGSPVIDLKRSVRQFTDKDLELLDIDFRDVNHSTITICLEGSDLRVLSGDTRDKSSSFFEITVERDGRYELPPPVEKILGTDGLSLDVKLEQSGIILVKGDVFQSETSSKHDLVENITEESVVALFLQQAGSRLYLRGLRRVFSLEVDKILTALCFKRVLAFKGGNSFPATTFYSLRTEIKMLARFMERYFRLFKSRNSRDREFLTILMDRGLVLQGFIRQGYRHNVVYYLNAPRIIKKYVLFDTLFRAFEYSGDSFLPANVSHSTGQFTNEQIRTIGILDTSHPKFIIRADNLQILPSFPDGYKWGKHSYFEIAISHGKFDIPVPVARVSGVEEKSLEVIERPGKGFFLLKRKKSPDQIMIDANGPVRGHGLNENDQGLASGEPVAEEKTLVVKSASVIEKQVSSSPENHIMTDAGNEKKDKTPVTPHGPVLIHGTVTVRNDGYISIPRTIRAELAITCKTSAFLSFDEQGSSLSFSLEKPAGVTIRPIAIASDYSFPVPDDWRESLHLLPGTKVVFTAVKGNGSGQAVTITSDVPNGTKNGLAVDAATYRAVKELTSNGVTALPALPAVRLDPAKTVTSSRKKIRKREGDLIIPAGRSGNKIRDCLGITSGTTHVYLKKVRDELAGYPLLQLFPSRPNGTTSTKTALSKDFRFTIPPDWCEDLSLLPGEEADIVVYRGEKNSTHAIITPATTATYQTALMYPVPPLQEKKPRERDTTIKNGKVWQSPPPTLDELKKDKKKLFARDPVINELLDSETVNQYRDYKFEVINLLDNLCQQVTDTCAANIDAVIQFYSDGAVSGKGTGVTGNINQLLGDQSNLNQAISLTLAGKAQGYQQSVVKLVGNLPDGKINKNSKKKKGKKKKDGECTVDSLSSWFTDHPAKWYEFLLFECSPNTYTCLARQWGVSRTFTRQSFHGIRYRLDKHLPPELQLNQPLPPFTEQGIIDACQLLEQQVNQTITAYLKAGKDTAPSRAFLKKVKVIEQNASEVTVYLNGFTLSEDQKVDPITTGWKSLKERSKAIATYILHEKNAEYKYHSALRAILSLAATDINHYPLAVTLQGLGVEEMTPERCLVKPFKSEKRTNNSSNHYYRNKSKLQPVDLIMGSNSVIYRPGKGLVLTALFNQYGVIEMQVPRFSGDRKPLVFYLPATPAMLQVIERGARVQMIRLHPPSGSSRKVKVDVVFYGPPWAFASTKHLELENFCPKCFTKLPPRSTCSRCKVLVVPAKLPEDTHLGIDLNRVGEYMVAFSTGDPLSAESQLSLLTLDTCKHYYNAKKELSVQQKALANREKRLAGVLSMLLTAITPDQLKELLSLTASGMFIRPFKDFIKHLGITGKKRESLTGLGYNILEINKQISLLHARIKNLRKALHELTTREIAIQLLLTGATTLACENLEGMDATGKKTPVAIATLNMPDEPAVIAHAIRNINALHRALGIPLEVIISPQNARGTSSTHAGCGGKLDRSPANWDMAKCKKCGQTVNTHISAALNVKFRSSGKPLVPVPVPPSSPSLPPTPPVPPPVP
ncbi:MAG: hypothetical protein ACXAEU_08820 [Candidatus Hodarchaeales archaeon]|jgi:bifunctional DNA-binding transcriptional regulator/antitoxin component of YhaV-PrlF toxin-antitoxin module